MEIKSFRIKNYRSIKDSGPCYLSGDNITILAGKNESGKTAILEALEDFNTESEIRSEAIPYHEQEASPEIALTFELNKKELKELSKSAHSRIRADDGIKIEIMKKYPNQYCLSEESVGKLHIINEKLLEKTKEEIKDSYRRILTTHSTYPQIGGVIPELDFDDIRKLKSELERFRNETQGNWPAIPDKAMVDHLPMLIDGIIKKIIDLDNMVPADKIVIEKIKQWIPNFILFVSFEDVFPSEVPLPEAANNELVRDLDIISNINLELIKSDSIAQKTKHKEQLNIRIKEDYKKFWSQDLTNLHIEWDSNKLYFFIKEDEDFYPPKIRSKGKQWHLSFYIRVAARAKEEVPNVILIDEPGLFLHAKAQKDVLGRLENSAGNAPIIFSTHSPYLIRIDKLNRIRLISRTTKKGTLISNKIHKGADKETLTPIITSIGLDLSMGLDIAKDNNIILEGISDYYYLCAFKELLKFKFEKEVHFIPGAGADKFGFLAPLMIGWGLNHCAVLDNDEKGRQTKEKLLRDFSHAGIKIIFVSDKKDEQIEDLFERDDFIKYVLCEEPDNVRDNKKNSQIIKHKDKVLLSKSFFEKTMGGEVSLSQNTNQKFQNFLEQLNKIMFPSD